MIGADAIISVRNLRKAFSARRTDRLSEKVVALEDVTFDIQSGELVSLVGPSGCGKTTLLRIIAGLIAPDQGSVHIGGDHVRGPRPDLCLVFQHFGLLPWRTVMRNVEYPLELDRVDRARRRSLGQEYIRLVGLEGFEDYYPHELSGGMQQRVGIARALVRRPSILLMDEPFGSLDAETREKLQEEFTQIRHKLRITVGFVTHSIDEALMMSDRILVFTSRPGKLRRVITCPAPKESDGARSPYGGEFSKLRTEIRAIMGSAADAT